MQLLLLYHCTVQLLLLLCYCTVHLLLLLLCYRTVQLLLLCYRTVHLLLCSSRCRCTLLGLMSYGYLVVVHVVHTITSVLLLLLVALVGLADWHHLDVWSGSGGLHGAMLPHSRAGGQVTLVE